MDKTKIFDEFDALRMRDDLIKSEFDQAFLTKEIGENGWGKYIQPDTSLRLDMHLEMQQDLKSLFALLAPMDPEDRKRFVNSSFNDLPLYWDEENEDLKKEEWIYLAKFSDISSMFKNLVSYIEECNLDMQRERG